MKSNRMWRREMKRYRIMEHELRGESVFTVEWNDKWFLGLWGRWHAKFHTKTLEEAIDKIQKIVSLKIKK